MANVTIIPEDYNALKKEYLVLRKEIDSANQELYGSKRQLKVLEALQLEYQNEIEILQSEQNTGKQKYEDKIAQLEEAITNLRLKCNEQVQALEADLSKKEEENEALQAEIELLKKINSTRTFVDDSSNVFEEIGVLKQEKEALLENAEELKLSLEVLQKNYVALEETLTEHREELSNIKENLSCKREELLEANSLVQKLNDEICCLKSELESYRSKPLNSESKGNSLFAEVDDRRVYLQKTINSMKQDYISMKQERARHLNLISHLRKENKALCDKWKADMEGFEDDQEMVLNAYKDNKHMYESLIEKYKKDLSTKPVVISTGSFSEIEFYQAMFGDKVKEIEELRDQISARGLTQTMLSMSLKEANKEIRKWRLEAKLRQYQLDLKTDAALSDNDVTEKVNEVMQDHLESKQTKIEPRLACRRDDKAFEVKLASKEVITINGSTSDVKDNVIVKREERIEKGKDLQRLAGVETKMEVVKSVADLNIDSSGGVKEEVFEDMVDNTSSKTSRKVTFTQQTVSPKITDRTVLKRNCRRLEVPKPIYIPSD